MYSLLDAKQDSSREIERLTADFIFDINSNNSEILISEEFIDILQTARLLNYSEACIKQEVEKFGTKKTVITEEKLSFENIERFKESLPIRIPSSESSDCVIDRDSSFKQLQRDIERDVVVINGVKVLGSKGIENVIDEICRTVDIGFLSCGLNTLDHDIKREFSIVCLQKASRTNSGGQSFQALQNCLSLANTLIVPKSSQASGLRILISLSDSPRSSSGVTDSLSILIHGKIGLHALIQTSTVFSIKNNLQDGDLNESFSQSVPTESQFENSELTVSVTYENSVSLEFNDILCCNLPTSIVAGEGLIIIDSYS